eukprot:CAMPEP_0175766790 /NCGR_PEP_ID=MMETSP0097-20121207/69563_1 /TAXON_ID=311494 /ORGANISM="Alexandrium monilatum, Strain CCMP3105" /LENGTH=173 /DNA_ID=CAMNT_0017076819 /DNA_START=13 /DNA_END=531 /DNA_ORIENTATION=+
MVRRRWHVGGGPAAAAISSALLHAARVAGGPRRPAAGEALEDWALVEWQRAMEAPVEALPQVAAAAAAAAVAQHRAPLQPTCHRGCPQGTAGFFWHQPGGMRQRGAGSASAPPVSSSTAIARLPEGARAPARSACAACHAAIAWPVARAGLWGRTIGSRQVTCSAGRRAQDAG